MSAPLIFAGVLLGSLVPQWLGLADNNDQSEVAEVIGIVVGALLAIGAVATFKWMYPTFELVDANEKTRAERFAKVFWGAVAALATGLLVSAIWAGVAG